MNKIFLGSALAAIAIATPIAVSAQQIAPAVVAVVDTQRILTQCTACTSANTQLQAQGQQLQARATQLGQPLEAEATAIQAAVNAAGGTPDAALRARITAFQTGQQNAQREVQGRQETLQRNRAFVLQQIEQRLNPIIVQIMQQRGATIALDRGATLAIAPQVEITDAVLALLNTQLPSVGVTAPPAAAAPAGQQPQQNRPRPQGR